MARQRNHPKGKYAVHYDSRNHISVITQLYGSIWDDIWLYCVFNVALCLLDFYFLDDVFANYGIKITDRGHSVSIFFVSFLVVSRVNMSLVRYNTARTNLSIMFANTRNLISSVAIQTKDDQSQAAKEWRNDFAYYTCLLLRLTMAVFDFEIEKIEPWTIPELKGEIKDGILKSNQITGITKQWAHMNRTLEEEVHRVPVTMSVFLRAKLQDSSKALEAPIPAPTMGRFNGLVDGFMGAFQGQRKLYTTPIPFPLVQMSRTMMFMWIFTLPLALDSDDSNVWVHCIVVFLLTYAMVGIETVSLELDDPFGDDENDIDNLGLAKVELEDVYNLINIVDGPEWAARLRCNMQGQGDIDGIFNVVRGKSLIKDFPLIAATENTPLV